MSQAANLEERASTSRARVRQDKRDPLLISMKDGMLFPNVPNIRKNPDYIVYRGDPKASDAERMKYVDSMKGGGNGRRRVINTAEAFDIGTATATELVDFALVEYETELNPASPVITLRKQVEKLAKQHDAMVLASSTKAEGDLS
jgi:hypothetical protein